VAVVAAGELHDLAAPGEAAGQPDGAHGGLGAAVDQAHLLDRPDALDDALGELDLARARRAEARAAGGGGLQRLDDGRVGVPRIIGPQEQTRSTYSRPSASVRYGPVPLTMKRGVPPTARKARTGELTPPGMTALARSNRACEVGAS
jgi:hypothetical protein